MMASLYLLVAVIGALIAVFAVQNINPVVIRFLGWQREAALSLVILLSILLGIILTSLVGLVPHWKLRSKIRQLENQVAQRAPSEREGPAGTRQ
jgi:lipopolysaccharide assembly protein A